MYVRTGQINDKDKRGKREVGRKRNERAFSQSAEYEIDGDGMAQGGEEVVGARVGHRRVSCRLSHDT